MQFSQDVYLLTKALKSRAPFRICWEILVLVIRKKSAVHVDKLCVLRRNKNALCVLFSIVFYYFI